MCKSFNSLFSQLPTTLLAAILLVGCGPSEELAPKKSPRPVSVVTLKVGVPPTSKQVSGSVGSWKTEQIGFEVAGRVLWVLEPGADIEGRILDSAGNVVTSGTALAKVDSERYELALEGSKAQVEVAELQKAGIEVDLSQGIPADLEAAKADLELAQVEYGRNKRLVAQNAAPQADLDKSSAQLRTSRAKIATLDANTKRTQAQLQSAIASIKQAQQSFKESQRNLADTTLYSSFRGQVADVHVVPGSVVAQGSPVATIQMMDPIKVEVELSAEQSRTIRRRHQLPVFVTMPDGSTVKQDGFVYLVAPSADTSTRTFTLTLLVLNRKIDQPIPAGHENSNLARTPDVWRMDFDFLPDAPEGTYYIAKKAMRKDQAGSFVWKCLNVTVGQPLPEILEVAKMRITPGNKSISFLGNWNFQTVTVDEGESFDPEADLFLGKLIVDDGNPDDWSGDRVLLARGGQWMLRPGDLVTLDLSETDSKPGLYVPMEAIYEESGETYVFAVEDSGDSTIVKRIPVDVAYGEDLGVGTVRRLKPRPDSKLPANELPDSELSDGMEIVVGGVHFLHDGEAVRVIKSN